MQYKNVETNQLVRGMNQDYPEVNQPQGTYRFALNAQLESQQGDWLQVSSENSNTFCAEIPEGFAVIGSVLGQDDEVILCLADDNGHSRIAKLKNCTLTTFINSNCLGFKACNPISMLFRVQRDCNEIIYITDGLNPYRSINLNDLERYLADGYTTVEDANDDGLGWNCDLFNHFLGFQTPDILLKSVNNAGGNLKKVGAYQFALRYLDKDFNPTNFCAITETIPLTDDYLYGNYDSVDGAAVDTPTGKSISLTLSNLDQSFPYYQLAVMKSIGGTGFVVETDYLSRESISSTTQDYLYTGDVETLGTLQDVQTPKISVDTVQHHTQVDNRLLLSNTKEKTKDWAVLQQVSNTIDSVYVIRETSSRQWLQGNAKDPDTYYFERTYMGDEVYAFGIQYIFKDGSVSPAFHIPGRQAFDYSLNSTGNANTHNRNQVPIDPAYPWDKQLLEVAPDDGVGWWDPTLNTTLQNVRHLGFTAYTDDPFGLGPGPNGGGLVERWRVYNTAIHLVDTLTGYNAYYECDSDYPDTLDCLGNRIYPTGKIRHHKFPDRTLEYQYNYDDDLIRNIGIRFYHGTAYAAMPSDLRDQIQGHYIVRVTRDEFSKTVADKGISGTSAHQITPDPNDTSISWELQTNAGTPIYNIVPTITPRAFFSKDLGNETYLKYENLLQASGNFFGTNETVNFNQIYQPLNYKTNNSIDGFIYVNAESTQSTVPPFTPYNLLNLDQSKDYLVYHTLDDIENINAQVGDVGATYVGIKRYVKPYENLFNLIYHKDCTSLIPDGASEETFSGDCFISELCYHAIREGESYFDSLVVTKLFVESEINCELRISGTEGFETNWRRFSANGATVTDYMNMLIGTYSHRGNYFVYNKDFSKESFEHIALPLTKGYEYCDNCQGSFPHRIYYSERSGEEDRADNYRIIKAANYRDIPGETGEITDIFTFKDNVYVHTSDSLWLLPIYPNEMKTDQNTVYIGTGIFLSIPPKQIKIAGYNYLGNQSKWTRVTNEFGVSWLNAKGGQVFAITDNGLQELSTRGMKSWFKNNSKLNLTSFLEKHGITICCKNSTTSFDAGTGYISYWDPRFKRMFLTKKDFEPLFDSNNFAIWTGSNPEGQVIYDTAECKFGVSNGEGGYYPVSIYDSEFFKYKNFTISYNWSANCWDSFHTYMPYWAFNDSSTFYTLPIRGSIWKHNDYQFQNYYDSAQQHVVTMIFNDNPTITKTVAAATLHSSVYDYSVVDDNYVALPYETYQYGMMYNSTQSTGYLGITMKNSSTPFGNNSTQWAGDNIKAERRNSEIRLNQFRNHIIDYSVPLFSTSWSLSEYAFPFIFGSYVDKVIPSSILNYNKSMFEDQRLKDKWVGLSLYYYSDSNTKKISTNLFQTLTRITYE